MNHQRNADQRVEDPWRAKRGDPMRPAENTNFSQQYVPLNAQVKNTPAKNFDLPRSNPSDLRHQSK